MAILSLLYVSKMVMAPNPIMIDALARGAAQKNGSRGITGLLLWNHVHFMQLLEGETQPVMDTMARIAADRRHCDLVYLRTEERQTRECPDWGMSAMLSPLTGAGALGDFANSLPPEMASDTRILFTSFASALRAIAA